MKKIKLLIVGSGDSIFLVNYVKSLKKYMDVEVHVYSPFPYWGDNKDLPYDEVTFDPYYRSKLNHIPFFSYMALPFMQRLHFQTYIKGKYFDIIHIHRIIPAWVISSGIFKKHCDKLFLSFWGGEIDREVLLRSHDRYISKLDRLVNDAYKVVGPMNDERITNRFPCIKDKAAYGVFGSSIIDELCKNGIDKQKARENFGVPNGKISVLLGYSGKAIHRHGQIVEELLKQKEFERWKDKIHFLASMTRGSTPSYTAEVENKIKSTGCSYTLLKNCYQTDEDVARLRIATDVLFQLSVSDYLSASVKENLCAGVVMISGSWLPYKILKDEGFYFEEVENISTGVSMFFKILSVFDNYRNKAKANVSLCGDKYTWDACIKDYISAYING